MLHVCADCTAAYAPGLACCPHCGSRRYRPDWEEETSMPRVTVEGGASHAAAGYPPEEAPAVPPVPPALPPVNAPKAEHANFVAQVLGLSYEEAEGKSKAELVDLARGRMSELKDLLG